MNFTHLHVHSHYSMLDGMSKIGDLIKKAKKNGMYAMALTDHGWVMIEANYEPDNKAWQMTSEKGIRDDFEEMKRRLKVK